MNRWSLWAGLLLWILTASGLANAADEKEFRAVTMLDGTVHRGLVLRATADALVLGTVKGEVSLPLAEMIQVDPLTRDAWLRGEGRCLLYLNMVSTPADAPRARAMDTVMLEVLQQDTYLVVGESSLAPARLQALNRCADIPCRLEVARKECLPILQGQLEKQNGQERIIFRRYDRNLQQVGDVGLQVGDPRAEQARLQALAPVLLGLSARPVVPKEPPVARVAMVDTATGAEVPLTAPGSEAQPAPARSAPDKQPRGRAESGKPGSTPAQAGPSTAAKPPAPLPPPLPAGDEPPATSPATAPEKAAPSAAKTPEAPRTPAKAEPSPSSATAPQPSPPPPELVRARRVDLLPVPGASSLLIFKDYPRAALAGGVVVALTGGVVFLAGDTRRLGSADGLSVPWPYEERGLKDALLVTGVGAGTYVLSTLLVNQLVRQLSMKARGPH